MNILPNSISLESALLLGTGLVLGIRHAFDRDHVAAVTHFVSLEPNPLKSAWFGLRWALGHAISVALLGVLILWFNLKFDPSFERTAELFIGIALVALGIWRLFLLWQERQHSHEHLHPENKSKHSHSHSHEPGSPHVHWLAPTLVGIMHGAAGTVEIFVLIPLTFMASRWLAASYILLFSAGCAFSMTLYGYLAGHFYHCTNQAGRKIYQVLVVLTSLSGFVLGAVWILKNI